MALLPTEKALSLEDFCNAYGVENFQEFCDTLELILSDTDVNFYEVRKNNKEKISKIDKELWVNRLYKNENTGKYNGTSIFPLGLFITLSAVQERNIDEEEAIKQIVMSKYNENIPTEYEKAYDWLVEADMPNEKRHTIHEELEKCRCNPNQRASIIEIIKDNKDLERLIFSQEELENAGYLPSSNKTEILIDRSLFILKDTLEEQIEELQKQGFENRAILAKIFFDHKQQYVKVGRLLYKDDKFEAKEDSDLIKYVQNEVKKIENLITIKYL